MFSGTLCVFDFLYSPPEADAGRGRTGDALPQPIQQCFDLSVLEFDDLPLSLIDHATACSEQNVPGLEQEGHVRRQNNQSPVPKGEIKRRRCETLEPSKHGVSRRFEFGGVF